MMRIISRPLIAILIYLCLVFSCSRVSGEKPVNEDPPPDFTAQTGAKPLAILQTGEFPLWFRLTENGPILLKSIEDAVFSSAFIPWPLAAHVMFFQEKPDELVIAVNRSGFYKFAPNNGTAKGIAMYRFGNEAFGQYTIGSFVFYDEKPAALLYLDDRFLASDAPVPSPRTWTFNMESNEPFPFKINALEFFPAEDGWDVDTLRKGNDGFWYYRAKKTKSPQPEILLLKTSNLSIEGEPASLEDFINSTPRKNGISHSLLPPLPEGFVYTGTAILDNSLFAFWEEQNEFYTGAAGFMAIKL